MENPSQTAAKADFNKDDGCSVDWNWLEGRKVAHATNDLRSILIEFEDGQTFKIQALTYKGEAFLSFTPYKDPKAAQE